MLHEVRRMDEQQRGESAARNATRGDAVTALRALLDHALAQAEETLAGRRELTDQALREIDLEITQALRMLEGLGPPWKHGDKIEYELMRVSLDKAIVARKKERRAELVRAWRDHLALQEKLLQLRRELIGLGRAKTV